MQITGTIKTVHDVEYIGQTQTAKRTVVIETETDSKYPKTIALTMWKDVATKTYSVGDTLTADFDIESREYNGKYYTDIKAYKTSVL
jgi:hypothetical protein